MSEDGAPDWTNAFAVRFAALFLLGMILMTAALWLSASQGWRPPDWLPQEVAFGVVSVGLAVVAALFGLINSWAHVFAGTAIALALHFGLLLLPPILLIGYPMSGYLVQDVIEAMAPFAGAYIVALTLTFLITPRKPDTKGQP